MIKRLILAGALLSVGIIAGCGGGGSSTPAATVSGVAATGAPMSGTVFLKDSANSPEMTASINSQNGTFSFDVSGKTPPYMLRAGSLYSMSGGAGTANINPMSTLMVADMAGFGNMSSMNSFYRNPNGNAMRTMFGNMDTALQHMRQVMGPLLATYGVAATDPILSPYTIGQGLDMMFDNVNMSIGQNGIVTMMNLNGMPIFTGPMGNMSAGTMMSGNIMQPGTSSGVSGITITPGVATLQVNGTQQFSANIPVTWSVGLSSGSITSGGLYTAPASPGMFFVKATSIADPTKSAIATVQVGSMGMMM